MLNQYPDAYGFVYLWYDRKRSLYYIGSHVGNPSDRYVSSSKWLNAAIRKRSADFRRRIIEWVYEADIKAVRRAEQRWLNMIRDEELSISENVAAGRNRYYNMKKVAHGGSHKGHTKTRVGSWNKGLRKEDNDSLARAAPKQSAAMKGRKLSEAHRQNLSQKWIAISPDGVRVEVHGLPSFCAERNIKKGTAYTAYRTNRPIARGAYAGWRFERG